MNVRKWFQLRLSTMLALTLAAGLLMSLNFLPNELGEGFTRRYGWPFQSMVVQFLILEPIAFNFDVVSFGDSTYVSLRYCIANLAILLAILAAIAFVLEWFARRKS